MNPYRIIQIIPAPAGMMARYCGVDEGEKYETLCPVVCFALMEGPRGDHYVRPMSMTTGDGFVDFVDDSGDFSDIVLLGRSHHADEGGAGRGDRQ